MEQQQDGCGTVIPVADLREYFRDSVGEAIQNQQVDIDDHAAWYVVNLLTSYSRSDAFYEDRGDYFGLPPLAVLAAEASEAANDDERGSALRRLGDVALFVSGFFAGSFARKPVDVDYYVHMGGGAYSSLADTMRSSVRGRLMASVFSELSARFQALVDVLNEVSEAQAAASHRDLVRVYEVWQKTGSRRAEKLLRANNVVPLDAESSH